MIETVGLLVILSFLGLVAITWLDRIEIYECPECDKWYRTDQWDESGHPHCVRCTDEMRDRGTEATRLADWILEFWEDMRDVLSSLRREDRETAEREYMHGEIDEDELERRIERLEENR